MSLPLSLRSRFSEVRDGLPAARFQSASEAHNMEVALRGAGESYKTIIVKRKRAPREFIVLLVGKAHEAVPTTA